MSTNFGLCVRGGGGKRPFGETGTVSLVDVFVINKCLGENSPVNVENYHGPPRANYVHLRSLEYSGKQKQELFVEAAKDKINLFS